MRKRPDEGLREVRLAHQFDPLLLIIQTQIGWTLQHAGRKAEARELLKELEALGRQRYVPAIAFARAYIGVVESERILQSLEKAYQQRENGIAYLALWKDHAGCQSDSRFRELLRRVGLTDK